MLKVPLIWIAILPLNLYAQSPTNDTAKAPDSTTHRLDNTIQRLDAVLKEGEQWSALEQANRRSRLNACNAAFGNEKFCLCLDNELNWALDFETYIRVISSADAAPKCAARRRPLHWLVGRLIGRFHVRELDPAIYNRIVLANRL